MCLRHIRENVPDLHIFTLFHYCRAHQLAVTFFSQKNGATQHTVKAVGNCHIDTGTNNNITTDSYIACLT